MEISSSLEQTMAHYDGCSPLKNPKVKSPDWLEILGMYDFKIIFYRPGRQHSNSGALSRLPCRQCGWTDSATESVNAVTRSHAKEILPSGVEVPNEEHSWLEKRLP